MIAPLAMASLESSDAGCGLHLREQRRNDFRKPPGPSPKCTESTMNKQLILASSTTPTIKQQISMNISETCVGQVPVQSSAKSAKHWHRLHRPHCHTTT